MSHRRLVVSVLAVMSLGAASCGSDDDPAATAAPSTTERDTSTTEALDESGASTTTVSTVADPTTTTVAPTTTTTTTATPATVAPDPGPEPGVDDEARGPDELCAAFESIFIAGLISSFAAFDDPSVIDPLLLGFMPELAERFEAAVATLPADGVPADFEQATRYATAVFAVAAVAVRAAGITDADLERLGSVLDPAVLEAGPSDGDLGDLIDDDVLDRLAAVEFDLDAELVDVPEPDETQLVALCPSMAEYLGLGGTTIEDACAIVDELALAVVFTEPFPAFDPDDVDTGMCSWEDEVADRELVVSVTDLETLEETRTGNEESMDVVAIDGLGDGAWSIDGFLAGISSTGVRGGFGSGRATVGAADGDRGLLVAVRAEDGDPVALATDVATILLGG